MPCCVWLCGRFRLEHDLVASCTADELRIRDRAAGVVIWQHDIDIKYGVS